MITQVADNIFTIQIPLPNNPLRWLNSYIIPGGHGGRNLIIDTGFKIPECYKALTEGLRELSIDLSQTDVFLSHLHADHTGNAHLLAQAGCRIIMGETDYKRLGIVQSTMSANCLRAQQEGLSVQELDIIFAKNPAVLYAPGPFEAAVVNDGDHLSYGGYDFQCIATPGHTPGHICLYDSEKKLILLGDHVLFDITPNITFWAGVDDSLKNYLDSLEQMKALDVEIALPAHRNCSNLSLSQRIDQLEKHHAARLNELEGVIKDRPGLSANQLAGLITWQIRARNWADFPPAQKWFAVGEAIAHLDYLVNAGRISRKFSQENACWLYS